MNKINTNKQLANMLKMRSWIYNFCGKSFTEMPTRALLKNELDQNLFSIMASMDNQQDGVPDLAKILNEMRNYSTIQWDELQSCFNELNQITIHTNYPLDSQVKKMHSIYLEWDLPPKILPSLFVEMGQGFKFMNFLICDSFDALEQGNITRLNLCLNTQLNFILEHFIPVIQPLCERISQENCHPFYNSLVQFIPSYLEMELELINTDFSNAHE